MLICEWREKHGREDKNPTREMYVLKCKNVRQAWTHTSTELPVDVDSLIVCCWTHCNVIWMYPEHFTQSKLKTSHRFDMNITHRKVKCESDLKTWTGLFLRKDYIKGEKSYYICCVFIYLNLLYAQCTRQNVTTVKDHCLANESVVSVSRRSKRKKVACVKWDAQQLMSHYVWIKRHLAFEK